MKVSEKECILEVLSQVRLEVEQELTKQNLRGDNRHKDNKSTLAVDGQCDGLEKAMKIIETKEEYIRGIRTERTEAILTENMSEVQKFMEMMELLRAGKKVAIDKRYCEPPIPTIKVIGVNGVSDDIPLDCCGKRDYNSYIPEQNISPLEEVKVISYTSGNSQKIEYIYTNPQGNRLYAHLEDGRDVDYDFSVIDVWHAYKGEYVPPKMREIELVFFKVNDNGHRKYYTTEKLEVAADLRVDEVVDFVASTMICYRGMDIAINFKPDDRIGYPCFIHHNERVYKE